MCSEVFHGAEYSKPHKPSIFQVYYGVPSLGGLINAEPFPMHFTGVKPTAR